MTAHTVTHPGRLPALFTTGRFGRRVMAMPPRFDTPTEEPR